MTNLSEDQYDRIAAHGKPTVTLNPRTWFRWDVILCPFRRKRPAAPVPGVTPPAPPALPEPTPPMQRVTVPQAPIARYDILAEAERIAQARWHRLTVPHAGNEPTLLLCARGLPMPFAPYSPDGEWRKGSRERIASEWQVCQMRNERVLTDALASGQTVYMDIVMRVPDVSEWRKLATNQNMMHAYAAQHFCDLVQDELAMRRIRVCCTPIMDIAADIQTPTWDVTMQLNGSGSQEASAA